MYVPSVHVVTVFVERKALQTFNGQQHFMVDLCVVSVDIF